MTDPKQSSSPPKEADKITKPPKEEKEKPQKTIRFVRAPVGKPFVISFS